MKTKFYIQSLFGTLLLLTILSSCQEVINVDLNASAPRLVIDASITDQPGPYTVLLTQSINFDQINSFPPVTGALVIVSDNAGNTDTLKEISGGHYITSHIQGTPGRTYTLTVNVNGTVYTSSSTMPSPVEMDTIGTENNRFGKKQHVFVEFPDPAGVTNYYRFYEFINGNQQTTFWVTSDRLYNGSEITYSLSGVDTTFNAHDSIAVQMACVDKNVYEFFRTARQEGNQTTTLSNPVSNITNGALGYFSAEAITKKTLIFQ